MDRVVARFHSFEEAEEADCRYYRQLTPKQRLDLLLEMIARHHEGDDASSKGFERVYRIVKLK